MSFPSIGVALLAPHRTIGGIHVSTTVIIIVAALAAVGALAIFGYRSPDRSPGADTQKQRERIED
ncbi:MAG TPA: hypothetical protein VE820_12785 [Sphingomicrobium sp.]|jgi:hypothetical protein|nr:hypothetical protein [Sphingomicrobium sp.]